MMGELNIENLILISTASDASVLASGQKKANKNRDEKENLLHEYCHKMRHTKNTYWKLHGKPQNWRKCNKFFGHNSGSLQTTTENAPNSLGHVW